jgi:hypothetical protein
MSHRRILVIAAMVSILVVSATSQDFTVPEGYKYSSQQDYTRAEPDVIRCIAFLETAPMGHAQRKAANRFLLEWLTGTSHVNVQVLPYVIDLAGKNTDLLSVYLGGWSRLVLQSDKSPEELDCHLAGVRSVLKAYQSCEGIESDDALDALVALEKDGKLGAWVKEKMEAK